MQQHLHLVENGMPSDRLFSLRHQPVDILPNGVFQRMGDNPGKALQAQVPAVGMGRKKVQASAGKMIIKGSRTLLRFIEGKVEQRAVCQGKAVILQLKVHRISTQPVVTSRLNSLAQTSIRRYRQVMLALDTEKPAQPGIRTGGKIGRALCVRQHRPQRFQRRRFCGHVMKHAAHHQMT